MTATGADPNELNKTIQSCFVEVLDYGEENLLPDDDEAYEGKSKKTMLSSDFSSISTKDTPDVPMGTSGVRISFDIVGSVQGARFLLHLRWARIYGLSRLDVSTPACLCCLFHGFC